MLSGWKGLFFYRRRLRECAVLGFFCCFAGRSLLVLFSLAIVVGSVAKTLRRPAVRKFFSLSQSSRRYDEGLGRNASRPIAVRSESGRWFAWEEETPTPQKRRNAKNFANKFLRIFGSTELTRLPTSHEGSFRLNDNRITKKK